MSGNPSYKYQESFQRRIAALCLKDPIFLQDYEDVVDPRYFDYDYITSIIRIAKGFVTKHREVPSKSTLVESVREHCDTYKVSEKESKEILDKLESLYSIDVIDPTSVKDRVIKFGQRQALKSAVMEIADIIDQDSEHDRALELVQSALQVGQSTRDLGVQAFGQFSALPKLMAESGIYDRSKKIPTMISSIDSAVFGGPGRKEVWMLMGLPGVGKSQWLVNMGANAINNGFNVIHITVGDLDQIDVLSRYSARLARVPIDCVIQNTEEYQRRAKKLDAIVGRYLRIKYYTAGSVTAGNVRAYISRLVMVDDIKPDLVIVDYPDKFRRVHDSDYTNMGIVYTDICGIAGDFNCLVWVASQVQRWSPKGEEEHITQDNVADSWRKAQDVDGVVSFNQTIDEYRRGRARAWIDKVRRGRKNFLVPLICDFSMSYIRQMTEEEVEKEKAYLELRDQETKKNKRRSKSNGENALEKERLRQERVQSAEDSSSGKTDIAQS